MPLRWTVVSQPRGFRGYLTKKHDGDSFWTMLDTAGDQRWEPELRLLDVPAPELNDPGGQETTDYTNGWLAAVPGRAPGRRWYLWVETVLTRAYEPTMKMTFTRYLATVWAQEDAAWRDPGRVPFELSLNHSVNTFLSGHPEWGPGD
jgi:hypothetical protein